VTAIRRPCGWCASRCCSIARKVKLGLEREGRVQVLEGIDPGENVVGRGAVFIDNESRS